MLPATCYTICTTGGRPYCGAVDADLLALGDIYTLGFLLIDEKKILLLNFLTVFSTSGKKILLLNFLTVFSTSKRFSQLAEKKNLSAVGKPWVYILQSGSGSSPPHSDTRRPAHYSVV